MRTALVRSQAVGGALDLEDRVDPRHRLDGDRSLPQVSQLEELAPGMRPAGCLAERAWFATGLVQPTEPGEGIRLHEAVEVAQPGLGMRARAVGGVEVGYSRWFGTTEGTVVTHHRPEPPRAGLALGQDRYGRVVEMQALSSSNMSLDPGDQERQGARHRSDPAGQRRDVDRHALVGKVLALAMQRQVQAELGHHHLGQEVRAGPAPRDRMEGSRGLRDGLAVAAGEALAHVLDHHPARRDPLQGLGDILAERAQARAATAGAGRWAGMEDALARQMLG